MRSHEGWTPERTLMARRPGAPGTGGYSSMATPDQPAKQRRPNASATTATTNSKPRRRRKSEAEKLPDETIIIGLEDVTPRRPKTWSESAAAIKAGFDSTTKWVGFAALMFPTLLGATTAGDPEGALVRAALLCWPVTIAVTAAIIVMRETNGVNPWAALAFFCALGAIAVGSARAMGVELDLEFVGLQQFPAAVLRAFGKAYGEATLYLAIIAGGFLGWVWVTRIRYHLGAN